MSAFQDAILLRTRCELEALVTRREGMVATNLCRVDAGLAPAYDERAFAELEDSIRAAAPDPHNFT